MNKIIYLFLSLAVFSCNLDSGYEYQDQILQSENSAVASDQPEFPDPEEVPEELPAELPAEPQYTETRYSVFGYWRSGIQPDIIEATGGAVFLNGFELTEEDYTYTIADGIRTIRFDIFIDQADQFFFRNTVFLGRFGIDYQNMSMDELRTFADIVNRYPAESMTVLLEEYGV